MDLHAIPPHPASTTSPNAGRSIIFFGHFSPQTHFMQFHRDVARAMAAQGWTVLWISPTGGIRQNPLEWLRGFPNGRLRREGTIWHFRPWGRPGRLFPSPKPRIRAKDRRQFAQVIQQCRLSSPAVLFYLPEELPLLQGIPHRRIAYWVGDIALTMLDTYPGMRSLTDAADTLLTISPRATADARAAYPDKVTPLFTGVAMDRFADPVIPKELASLAHPVVGYAGSIIADRFDIELFVACAERLPEVSFVLVGLIEPALREELLRRGPRNLRVLGPRPYDAVPGILSAFDVGIVPYLVNDFNAGSNPLKLYEYFAAGLPVVSTPLSAIEEAGDLVRFASDGEGFASAIREALREDDQTLTQRRRAYAEAHSTMKIAETISASLTDEPAHQVDTLDPSLLPPADELAVALYLDLLKQTLTRSIGGESYAEWAVPRGYRGARSRLKYLSYRILSSLLGRRQLTIMKRTEFNPQARKEGTDWPAEAETMVGVDALDSLQMCVLTVLADEIPGDLIETGAWRGGASIFMRAALKAYGANDRTVWVADSFEGLPKPEVGGYPEDQGDAHWKWQTLAVSLEEVQANFQRYGMLDDQVRFLVGWFKDTLPKAPIDQLAILRLDGDMYGSTMDALMALGHKVSPGGFIIVDDYRLPGCHAAIGDFRKARGITAPIQEIGAHRAYWRVPFGDERDRPEEGARDPLGSGAEQGHSTEVLAERSVVIFGHFSPHTHFLQFNRDLGRALAERGWIVLWVSPPGGVREDPVGWLGSFREGSLTREGNLWDFRPWGIPKRPFPPRGGRGFAKVRRQLADAVERCGMTSPALLFWDPNEFPLAAELTSERSVYWAGDTTLRRLDSGEGLREILASMDVLLTISPEATEDARRLHPEKVQRISTGVTIERFDHPVPPFDMAMVPRPIAGFAGSANTTRFDLNLFVACARELPDVSFVLVGPVEPPIAAAIQQEALPNIHLFGERPYEDVPGYIAGFDVGIVPYLLNDFNAGSNPLKVFECFAAGVPVVSTRLTAVQEAGDLVRFAATAQEFAAAIREAIEEDDLEMTAKRRAYAAAHSTERVADILEQALRG